MGPRALIRGLESQVGDATTSSQSAFFVCVSAAQPRGATRFDPKKSRTIDRHRACLPADERHLPSQLAFESRKVKIMPLIQLLEVLIVVGVLLWLVNRFIPMQGSIKSILNGVVVIAVVLWLLNVFGLFHSLSSVRIGT
jgi:hypothetical protein